MTKRAKAIKKLVNKLKQCKNALADALKINRLKIRVASEMRFPEKYKDKIAEKYQNTKCIGKCFEDVVKRYDQEIL